MDCTSNLQKSENKTTHLLTGLACLTALQGNPDGGLKLMWHKHMEVLFKEAKGSKACSKRVMELLIIHKSEVLTLGEFGNIFETNSPSASFE
jgi:hypothetical protein